MAVAPAGQSLLLKRAALSRPSGQWNDEDYDVLAGVGIGGSQIPADSRIAPNCR
jgi:hypothetical protein